jgi:hypothetical protein
MAVTRRHTGVEEESSSDVWGAYESTLIPLATE